MICVVIALLWIVFQRPVFKIVKSEGDGMCFYHSFLQYLHEIGHVDSVMTAPGLKQNIFENCQDQNSKSHLLRILDPTKKIWATDEILQFVANMYNVDIFLREQIDRKWVWTQISAKQSKNPDCHILFQNYHFDYIKQ